MIVQWDHGKAPVGGDGRASMVAGAVYLSLVHGTADEMKISEREDGFLIESLSTGSRIVVRPVGQRSIQVEVH